MSAHAVRVDQASDGTRLLTVSVVARLTGYSPRTIRYFIESGELAATRLTPKGRYKICVREFARLQRLLAATRN